MVRSIRSSAPVPRAHGVPVKLRPGVRQELAVREPHLNLVGSRIHEAFIIDKKSPGPSAISPPTSPLVPPSVSYPKGSTPQSSR